MAIVLGLIGVYLALGAAFAIVFVSAGVARIDPAARGASWPFRLVILPGVAALWPWMLLMWTRAPRERPELRASHDGARP
mgnify:CR=1 FL=1